MVSIHYQCTRNLPRTDSRYFVNAFCRVTLYVLFALDACGVMEVDRVLYVSI